MLHFYLGVLAGLITGWIMEWTIDWSILRPFQRWPSIEPINSNTPQSTSQPDSRSQETDNRDLSPTSANDTTNTVTAEDD